MNFIKKSLLIILFLTTFSYNFASIKAILGEPRQVWGFLSFSHVDKFVNFINFWQKHFENQYKYWKELFENKNLNFFEKNQIYSSMKTAKAINVYFKDLINIIKTFKIKTVDIFFIENYLFYKEVNLVKAKPFLDALKNMLNDVVATYLDSNLINFVVEPVYYKKSRLYFLKIGNMIPVLAAFKHPKKNKVVITLAGNAFRLYDLLTTQPVVTTNSNGYKKISAKIISKKLGDDIGIFLHRKLWQNFQISAILAKFNVSYSKLTANSFIEADPNGIMANLLKTDNNFDMYAADNYWLKLIVNINPRYIQNLVASLKLPQQVGQLLNFSTGKIAFFVYGLVKNWKEVLQKKGILPFQFHIWAKLNPAVSMFLPLVEGFAAKFGYNLKTVGNIDGFAFKKVSGLLSDYGYSITYGYDNNGNILIFSNADLDVDVKKVTSKVNPGITLALSGKRFLENIARVYRAGFIKQYLKFKNFALFDYVNFQLYQSSKDIIANFVMQNMKDFSLPKLSPQKSHSTNSTKTTTKTTKKETKTTNKNNLEKQLKKKLKDIFGW